MLVSLVAAALIALLAGQALPRLLASAPALSAHVVLALGVWPLISAAMLHFAPVLTHSRPPGRWPVRLPWLMLLAGLLAVSVFGGPLDYLWLSLAAGLGLTATLGLLAWLRGRSRAALGPAHPGLAWYQAALVCLVLGLLAALLIPLLPVWHAPLRAFHLHINLYGFVALTAVGTLQVLMPTVAGQADAEVGRRLRTDLKWALGAALGLALGEALGWPWLTGLGVLGWGAVLLRMGVAWWQLHRARIFAWHGAAPLLAAAGLGLAASLLGVAMQAAGQPQGGLLDSPLSLFLPAFLMPLVSGAAGHLAPIWLAPGRRAEVFVVGQRRLTRWAGLRALLFSSAAAMPLLGFRCAGMPALLALVWFILLFMHWLWREDSESGG